MAPDPTINNQTLPTDGSLSQNALPEGTLSPSNPSLIETYVDADKNTHYEFGSNGRNCDVIMNGKLLSYEIPATIVYVRGQGSTQGHLKFCHTKSNSDHHDPTQGDLVDFRWAPSMVKIDTNAKTCTINESSKAFIPCEDHLLNPRSNDFKMLPKKVQSKTRDLAGSAWFCGEDFFLRNVESIPSGRSGDTEVWHFERCRVNANGQTDRKMPSEHPVISIISDAPPCIQTLSIVDTGRRIRSYKEAGEYKIKAD